MSHDRGCFCGREKWEYNDCTHPNCYKKKKKEERFNYCFGYNPHENGLLKSLTYPTAIHYGSMQNALDHYEKVKSETPIRPIYLYKLVKIDETPFT